MTGSVAYLNGVPVTFRSSTQKIVSLLTSEAELNAAVIDMQDAVFVRKIMKSLGLKAEHLYGRVVDISNKWSVGRRTCHMEVKQNFCKN